MKNRWFWPLLLLVGLALRAWQLGAALWYDEVFSALMAGLPLQRLFDAAAGDVHPPTYYLLLSAVAAVAGASEIAMRLPSLLAGLLLIPLVYRLAGALGCSRFTARLGATLTTLAPFQLYYSSEARSYALLSLAVGLAALGLVERRYWLAVIGSLAALYLHNTAVLFLAPVWLVSLRNERRYWLAGVGVAVGYLPGLWWAWQQAGHISGNYWIPRLSSPGRLIATIDDMFWFLPKSTFVFASALVTALVLLLIVFDARRLVAAVTGRFLLAAVFAPLFLLALVSLVWQPVLISRVMAPAAPFYYVLVADVVGRSRRRLGTIGALAAPVLLATLVGWLTWQLGRDPIDPALAAQLRSYDAVYHSSVGGAITWRYYLPDVPQFVYAQRGGLDETLSQQTRIALGLDEIEFDLIKCVIDGQKPLRHWGFMYFHSPVTTPAEIEYVDGIMRRYKNTPVRLLRSDTTTVAGLVEIKPECD